MGIIKKFPDDLTTTFRKAGHVMSRSINAQAEILDGRWDA